MIQLNDFIKIIKENHSDYVRILKFEKNNNKIKQNYIMIKEKILLYNDSSLINQKCLSCYQFSHSIENCPKLHYLPSSETIIKKLNFPFINQRTFFHRTRKRLPNSLKSRNLNQVAQKKLEGNLNIKIKSKLNQSLVSSNSSEFDDEEKTEKDAAEDIDKMVFKQQEESMHEEFVRAETKNFNDEKIYLSQFTKVNENDSTVENPLAKMREGMEKDNSFEYLMKKKILKNEEGIKKNSQANLNIAKEVEFEKVCLFQNYFPSQNIDKIIGKIPKLLTMEKEITKKYLRRKYKKLKYYSFIVNPIVETFLEESKAKKSNKKNISLFHRRKNVHERTEPFLSTLKSTQNEECSRCSPLKKKSYFQTDSPSKKEKVSFADLIKTLVEKNRQTKYEIKTLGKTLTSGKK